MRPRETDDTEDTVASRQARSRRFWFDPRFAIGVVLIVVSVAATVVVVSAADSTAPALAARHALVPGQTVHVDDLVVSRVALDRASDLYLSPGDIGEDGFVVARTVASGELVPVSALGDPSSIDLTPVVVATGARLAESVGPGSVVDVWAAAAREGGGFSAPVVIVPTATVVRILKPTGLVVDESASSAEVLVPKATVARVLEAIADDDALSLVPTTVPVG